MAAEPVSPLVAVRIMVSSLAPSFFLAQVMSRGRMDRAMSLNAAVGPWYSSSTACSPAKCVGAISGVSNFSSYAPRTHASISSGE